MKRGKHFKDFIDLTPIIVSVLSVIGAIMRVFGGKND